MHKRDILQRTTERHSLAPSNNTIKKWLGMFPSILGGWLKRGRGSSKLNVMGFGLWYDYEHFGADIYTEEVVEKNITVYSRL